MKFHNIKELLKAKYLLLDKNLKWNTYLILMSLSLGSIQLYDCYQKYHDTIHIEYNSQTSKVTNQSLKKENLIKEIPDTRNIIDFTTLQETCLAIALQEVSSEEKLEYILERYHLTEKMFNILVSIILTECKSYDINSTDEKEYLDCYTDAYATINTIYNRTTSNTWSCYIDQIMGEGLGTNLYYQSICPGQFNVYENGDYLKYIDIDKTELPGYIGIIDFLYSEDKMHNYLSFVSSSCVEESKIQFVPGGNCYYNEQLETDILEIENSKILSK